MVLNTSLNQLNDIIEKRTGLAPTKQPDIDFPALLKSLSNGNIREYINHLRNSNENTHDWQELLQALTINETYFLREKSHFDLISAHMLPKLIEKRRANNDLHLNIWSVGCASGEEPYSLAITLKQTLKDFDKWNIRLFGTDLNTTAVNSAQRGVYRKWAFRHTSVDFQNRYFVPTPDGLLIKPDIRNLVTFRTANLLNGPPLPQMDIILCRNVLLYFTQASARRAEVIFHDTLIPEGWLLLGQSETLGYKRDKWVMHLFPGTPIYQKRGAVQQSKPISSQEIFLAHDAVPDVIDTKPLQRVVATYDTALQAIHDEDYERAEMLLQELIENSKKNAPTYVMLALVYANRNRFDEAHKQLDNAIELDPLIADAHYLRGTVFMEEGKTEEASKELHATLYCQRNHPLASFLLGNLYAQQGDIPKATKFWKNALTTVTNLQEDSPVSSISDMSAGRLHTLVSEQLAGWED